MIFEAKQIQKSFLNFATTKPCFTAQNAASRSVTGYSQLAPDFEIPCLGPCRARFGKAGGYLAVLRDSQQNPKHICHMLCEILDPCCLLVLYLSGKVFQKLHDRLQIFMFFDWILFLFLILVSDPLVRFSIFFIAFSCLLVCIVISALWSSHCILGLFEHMT